MAAMNPRDPKRPGTKNVAQLAAETTACPTKRLLAESPITTNTTAITSHHTGLTNMLAGCAHSGAAPYHLGCGSNTHTHIDKFLVSMWLLYTNVKCGLCAYDEWSAKQAMQSQTIRGACSGPTACQVLGHRKEHRKKPLPFGPHI